MVDIAPGANWDEQIEQAIRPCAAVLFVVSRSSVARTTSYSSLELELARGAAALG